MLRPSALVVLSYVASLVAAVPFGSSELNTRARPALPYPNQDPFYLPPKGFQNDKPGTVYRRRTATAVGIPGVTGTQLLHRTNDALLNPTVTVTTVLQNNQSSRDYLVTYGMYEDGAATQCAPSYCFNTNDEASFCPNSGGLLAGLMQLGFTVIVTDDEGPNSAFSAGHIEGYTTLDGLRAAINFLRLDKKVIIGGLGYSGGAIAMGWTAGLAKAYAPELNIRALAFGGTPANPKATLQKIDGTVNAGFNFGGLAGGAGAYPALAKRFEEIATSRGVAYLEFAQTNCGSADLARFANDSIFGYDITTLGPNLLTDPVISHYLDLSIMALNKTETPAEFSIFMFHSTTDEIIPYANALSTAQTWCNYGSHIDFVTSKAGLSHSGTFAAYVPSAFEWLSGQLRGAIRPIHRCSFTSQTTPGLPQ